MISGITFAWFADIGKKNLLSVNYHFDRVVTTYIYFLSHAYIHPPFLDVAYRIRKRVLLFKILFQSCYTVKRNIWDGILETAGKRKCLEIVFWIDGKKRPSHLYLYTSRNQIEVGNSVHQMGNSLFQSCRCCESLSEQTTQYIHRTSTLPLYRIYILHRCHHSQYWKAKKRWVLLVLNSSTSLKVHLVILPRSYWNQSKTRLCTF